MVKSTSSCFKIITCSSDIVEDDDLERTESKGSTDKRRWSFRKGSGRHQGLNNTMISELSSPGNKEKPESTNVESPARTFPAISEKISATQWTDDPRPVSDATNSSDLVITKEENASKGDPDLVMSKEEKATKVDPLISTESLSKTDSLKIIDTAAVINSNLEESAAVVIQAAIRRYLSRRALLKLKNVIKLQAAFRGLLVRRQAVGTLRCVQAIIKMQALVRARHARMSLEGSAIEEKLDEKHDDSVKSLVRGIPGTNAKPHFSSSEKLLGNGFARQLLESMPKKKPIRVKCDPLRSDSAWKWLERWVSVSPSDFAQPQKPQSHFNSEKQVDSTDRSVSGLGTEVLAEAVSDSTDLKTNVRETKTTFEDEQSLIADDPDNFQFQFCPPTSIVGNVPEQSSLGGVALSEAQQTSSDIDISPNEWRLDSASDKLLQSISSKPEANSDPPKHFSKQVGSEPETESKKIVVGSRKVRNPAFAAAQSKFEELSTTATAGRSISSSHTDVAVELKSHDLSPSADSLTRSKEPSIADNSISHDPKIHIAGLECGTELPISLPLGSPERPEHENESEVKKEGISDLTIVKDNASYLGNPDDANEEAVDSIYANGEAVDAVNANGHAVASIYANGAVASVHSKGEAVDSVYPDGEAVDLALASVLPQAQQPERSASDVQIQLDTAEDQQAYRSSPDGSPRSHITGTESRTPSSQLSVDAKKEKSKKSEPSQKRKSRSGSKRSPSNLNHDSGGRNSTEELPKDLKNGKRRNSLGLAKLDFGDQESRDSSNNSLPSYMQATKSAKAKAQANNSPRSSPDVQDNEVHIKKRHSLPNTNGKQGSPRIQSSTPPQAQQGAKGNRERWQR